MIVPAYWAEGRVQHRAAGKQVTVRRFGWSDASMEEAQHMADARAQEGLRNILAGDKSPRREPKVPYNGAEGVPIREEVVSRHGDCVITRNSYGARCLNTPNVLFVDVDFEDVFRVKSSGCILQLVLTVALGAVAYAMGWHKAERWMVVALVFGIWVLGAMLKSFWMRSWRWYQLTIRGGVQAIAMGRVREFVEKNRDWNVRVYRTPAGLRVMAVHRKFDPGEQEVERCFAEVGTDEFYAQMCRNQRCFRARLDPKPWRVGMSQHLKPRPGTWPVKTEYLPKRREWIAAYEAKAANFAACSWLEDIGNGIVSSEVRPVMELHDRESRALSGLPIA